jgi:hypothetical protein
MVPHYLLGNKRMQAGADARTGTVAQFRLAPDAEKRIATVSAQLRRSLAEDRALRRWFNQVIYSTRREIGDWISQEKSAGPRLGRAAQIAEHLHAIMDFERALPPVMKAVFAERKTSKKKESRPAV